MDTAQAEILARSVMAEHLPTGWRFEWDNAKRRGGSCSYLYRHTCATHMLEGGADIRFIQQLLGHASIETTQIYTEVSIHYLREVYEKTHPNAQS